MNNQEIANKLWKEAGVLRKGGVTSQDYLTELTFLLFLKMCEEQDQEEGIPEQYRWNNLVKKEGIELLNFYRQLLIDLGNPKVTPNQKVNTIYNNASTTISAPATLEKLIKDINNLDWFSEREESLGNLYESLMQRSLQEVKTDAGQYFTPRALINMMVKLTQPQIGERLNDPAAGTFGFMVAADNYLRQKTDDYSSLSSEQEEFQIKEAFSGMELVPNTHRLALMNEYLHGLDGKLALGDSLSTNGMWMKKFDLVLTNPPFGTDGDLPGRDDITFPSANNQLNFIQIIYNSLRRNGKARAAVVVPDNVLFADGIGEKIRQDLLNKCNVHTILRLPAGAGIFYAQGVQTNVLFFTRGKSDKDSTKETWIYDMRHQMRSFGKRNPLNDQDFEAFEKVFNVDDISKREETWDAEKNPNGRWRKFSIDEIKKRPNTSLDISWMNEEKHQDTRSINEILNEMNEKSKAISDAIAELNKALEGIDDED